MMSLYKAYQDVKLYIFIVLEIYTNKQPPHHHSRFVLQICRVSVVTCEVESKSMTTCQEQLEKSKATLVGWKLMK